MENSWIIILLAIVANILGAVAKANQRKKPVSSTVRKNKNAGYNYKNRSMMPEVKKGYAVNTGFDDISAKQRIKHDEKKSFPSYSDESAVVMGNEPVDALQYENISEQEETYDLGLSELQHAIIMSEVLNKPLALRKK